MGQMKKSTSHVRYSVLKGGAIPRGFAWIFVTIILSSCPENVSIDLESPTIIDLILENSTVSVIAEDNVTSTDRLIIRHQINDSAFMTGDRFELSTGRSLVTVIAEDEAGNVSKPYSEEFVLDNPATISAQFNNTDIESDSVINVGDTSTVDIDISLYDLDSIVSVYVNDELVASPNNTEYQDVLTLDGLTYGQNEFSIRITDEFGFDVEKNYIFKRTDANAPQIDITKDGDSITKLTVGVGSDYSFNVYAISGNEMTSLTVDESNVTDTNDAVDIIEGVYSGTAPNEVGEITIPITAENADGITDTYNLTIDVVDNIAPNLTAEISGSNLVIDAADAHSGIDEILVDIDGTITSYSSSDLTDDQLTIPLALGYGSHTIDIVGSDLAGNNSDEINLEHSISDSTVPNLNAYMTGSDLIIETSDLESGIDEILVDINGTITSYDSSDLIDGKLTIPVDLPYGDYVFDITSTDAATNTSNTSVDYHSPDLNPPVINNFNLATMLLSEENSQVFADADNEDLESGIALKELKIEKWNGTSYDLVSDFTLFSNGDLIDLPDTMGKYKATVKITDNESNASESSRDFYINQITINKSPGDYLYKADGSETFTVDAGDLDSIYGAGNWRLTVYQNNDILQSVISGDGTLTRNADFVGLVKATVGKLNDERTAYNTTNYFDSGVNYYNQAPAHPEASDADDPDYMEVAIGGFNFPNLDLEDVNKDTNLNLIISGTAPIEGVTNDIVITYDYPNKKIYLEINPKAENGWLSGATYTMFFEVEDEMGVKSTKEEFALKTN